MGEPVRKVLLVFLHDGDIAIGAVRGTKDNDLIVCIESAGDYTSPRSAVHDVHLDKVILDSREPGRKTRAATGRAHAAEDDEDHEPNVD